MKALFWIVEKGFGGGRHDYDLGNVERVAVKQRCAIERDWRGALSCGSVNGPHP